MLRTQGFETRTPSQKPVDNQYLYPAGIFILAATTERHTQPLPFVPDLFVNTMGRVFVVAEMAVKVHANETTTRVGVDTGQHSAAQT